ncbi:hypothetical protein NE865_04780 [Phthorimaea operculella]|nr:hypothetical protein NE865_04780 [Phthorimaea operculella]
MLKVRFLTLLAFVTTCTAVIFEDCGSAYDLHAVDIEGCGFSLPCYVTLGEETPVELIFYADFPSNLLDQNVVINVNLVLVNADVTPDNCGVDDDCPVKTGIINTFNSVMSVPKRMALNQRGYLFWRVYNEEKRLLICYSVLVQTQSPAQKALRRTLSKITAFANDIVDNLGLDELENLDIDSSLSDESEAGSNEKIDKNYLQQIIDQYFEQKSKAESD